MAARREQFLQGGEQNSYKIELLRRETLIITTTGFEGLRIKLGSIFLNKKFSCNEMRSKDPRINKFKFVYRQRKLKLTKMIQGQILGKLKEKMTY